ncbi:MAG: ribonuclease P protein component, partial [Candidatus Kapaibacterium sp.]
PVSFGISIPKRHAKKAVVRNRTKRLVKESLISLANIEKEKLLTFEEFVLIRTVKLPSHPKLVRLDEVKSEIFVLFDKALMRIG